MAAYRWPYSQDGPSREPVDVLSLVVKQLRTNELLTAPWRGCLRTVTSLPHGARLMPRRAIARVHSVRVPLDFPRVGARGRLLVSLVRTRRPCSGGAAEVGHAASNHHCTPRRGMAVGRPPGETVRDTATN